MTRLQPYRYNENKKSVVLKILLLFLLLTFISDSLHSGTISDATIDTVELSDNSEEEDKKNSEEFNEDNETDDYIQILFSSMPEIRIVDLSIHKWFADWQDPFAHIPATPPEKA